MGAQLDLIENEIDRSKDIRGRKRMESARDEREKENEQTVISQHFV